MTQSPAPSSAAPEWVALAVFAQPHGVSGRIKVKSFTDPEDAFASNPHLTDEKGTVYKLTLTGHTQGMAIVAVEGVTKREQAELLRGKKLGVARTALPELEKPNQYYTDDLVGMAVVEGSGAPFGTVTAVVNYGASDILDIKRTSGAQELYAFTAANFPEIDTAARRITIDPPVTLNAARDDESA